MLPAKKGLGADQAAGSDLDDRLIEQPEFIALDGPAKIRLQGQAIVHGQAHLRFEHRQLTLAARLCPIHRDVRVAQDRFRGGVSVRRQCHSDAGRDEELPPANLEGDGKLRQKALAGHDGLVVVIEII